MGAIPLLLALSCVFLSDPAAVAKVFPRVQSHAGNVDILFEPKSPTVSYKVYKHARGMADAFELAGSVGVLWTDNRWSIVTSAVYVTDSQDGFAAVLPDINSSEYMIFSDTGDITDYEEYSYLVTEGEAFAGNPEAYAVVAAFPPSQSPHGSYSEFGGTCTGCHGLHSGSSTQKLLKAPTTTDLCLTCHLGAGSRYKVDTGKLRIGPTWNDVVSLPGGHTPAVYQHNVYRATSMEPPSLQQEWWRQFSCGTCHDPHNRSYNYRNLRGVIDTSQMGQGGPSGLPPSGVEMAVRGFTDVDTVYGTVYSRVVAGGVVFCTTCHRTGVVFPNDQPPFTVSLLGHDKAGDVTNNTGPWPTSAHAASNNAGANTCTGCHATHGSSLSGAATTQGSMCGPMCHNQPGKSVEDDWNLPSTHNVSGELHGNKESNNPDTRHAACPDCHEPHAARSAATADPSRPQVSPTTLGTSYLTVQASTYDLRMGTVADGDTPEFGVCLKCHSSYYTLPPGKPDMWAQFRPWNGTIGNLSFHPVAYPGQNSGIRPEAFAPGWSADSFVRCSHCHRGPNSRGPHGSSNAKILGKPTPDLCFDCHSALVYTTDDAAKSSRFRGMAGGGEVSLHVFHTQPSVGCGSCHRTHGSPNQRLIGTRQEDPTSPIASFSYAPWPGTGACAASCHDTPDTPYTWSPAY